MKKRSLLLSAAAFMVGAAVGYFCLLRPRLNRWGSTEHESAMNLPGDELAGDALVKTTHALDIDADVNTVWPWLLQIGQGRGGFYTYSWLENLAGSNIRNVTEIHGDLQDLTEGDNISIHPKAPAFRVASLNPPDDLVLIAEDIQVAGLPLDKLVWSFHLRPHGRGSCRLIARTRAATKKSLAQTLRSGITLEPTHFLLERKMLVTIRSLAERAERRALLI